MKNIEQVSFGMLKPAGMDTVSFRVYEALTGAEAKKIYKNVGILAVMALVVVLANSQSAHASSIFGIDSSTGKVTKSTAFTGDGSAFVKAIARTISAVRWICLGLGTISLCWSAIKLQQTDQHSEAWKNVQRAGSGLIIVGLSVSLVNFIIGVLNV